MLIVTAFYRMLRRFDRVEKITDWFVSKEVLSEVYFDIVPDDVRAIEALVEAPSQLILQLFIVFRGYIPGKNV